MTVVPVTNLFLVDIKHAHRPEVLPDTVFSNLAGIAGSARIRIRIPVIPHWNDTAEEVRAIRDRLLPFRDAVEQVELLPFHNSAGVKYRQLNRIWNDYEGIPPVPQDRIERYTTLFGDRGFTVR